jgi:uncharacterized protein YndB with AHSA1/START domain
MIAMDLPHVLTREIVIRATRETVFRFFTDPARWASWWGAGSTIDPRPGGALLIRYPGGVEAAGEVLELERPDRIVFTYGFVSGNPIPVGSSRVEIRLEPDGRATRLRLTHAFAEPAVRDHHVQGWRYQLSVFANVVADEVQAHAASLVDAWFAAWAETSDAARAVILAGAVVPGVRFRDRYSLIDGMDELLPHIAAAQKFMPGYRPQRRGEIRHCQGTVLADWVAAGPDGQRQVAGTNVFTFDEHGRIESVVGLWSPSNASP